MTKRTLTDELRSVLLFHSLEAPEPEDTVTRILASTVGPRPGSQLPTAAEGTPSRRWRPSGQLMMAACLVAVIVLAAAGINTARHRNSAPTAASAAQGTVDSVQSEASRPASASSGRGPMLVQPQASAGRRAAPATAPAYTGSALDCSTVPGGRLVTGAWDDFRLSTGQQRYVYEFLCVGTDGQRSASEVQMFEQAGNTLRYVTTLLHPAANEHLDFITATTDSVRIQFSVNRSSPGGVAGAVESMAWEFSDPNGGKGLGAVVAEACLRKDVAATVVPAAGSPASWRLVLRNRTGAACALEGFPTVVALRNGAAAGSPAAHRLNGPAGGVRKALVPPIIVLTPGATAAAVLEASAGPSCPSADQLAVTLPNGVSLGELEASVPTCGLVVHPLVGNPAGSD
jgi:hypothetical protein